MIQNTIMSIKLLPLNQVENGTTVSFLAFVHQIHQDKLKDKKHCCVWIGDPSVPFFKLHAWSDECTVVARKLQAGDICCFQEISIRCFRGNKEAHLTRDSFFNVFVRKNQFQNVTLAYVPFTSIMPLVEWTKDLHAKGFGLGQGNIATVKIKDLREHMLAHVVCRLRPVLRQHTLHYVDDDRGPHTTLRQLVMVDGPDDGILLNIWHDHFDPSSIPLGVSVEVRHIVVSFNSLRHSLMANTTSESVLVPLTQSPASSAESHIEAPLLAVDTFAEAAAGQFNGRMLIHNVILEALELAVPSTMGTWQTAQLVEGYCAWCECALPEQPNTAGVVPPLYGPCANRCQHAKKSMSWRYRPATLIVRDSSNQAIRLHVQDAAMQALVGHIPAAAVADCRRISTGLDARETVRFLLEAVPSPVAMTIQVYCHFFGGEERIDDGQHPMYSFVSMEG
ncbi:hypothetical protein AeMF1_010662 [Aphanomyces euteiches]|nr:hypothetical protein AeMF1_010662 [Aphanomyces euteiches]